MVTTGYIHQHFVYTFYLAYTDIRPIGGPWSFCKKMRILAGGQVLGNIDMYNWAHELFNTFNAEDSKYNDYAEGFVNTWEGVADNNAQTMAGVDNANVVSDTYFKRDTKSSIPDRTIQTIGRIFQLGVFQSLLNCH